MNSIYIITFLLLFQFFFAGKQALESPQTSPLPNIQQEQNIGKATAENPIFKSTDGGQTWQDISKGLTDNVGNNFGIEGDVIADANGLYLAAGDGLYHTKSNSTAPFWTKEMLPVEHSSIAAGKAGIYAYSYGLGILQQSNRTGAWAPVFTNFTEKRIRSIFETAGGTIFIGSDNGLFKSTDNGKKWKHVLERGGKPVEYDGVLVTTSSRGIVRSTDDGETWDLVISEGGVGIAVESIKGGFAAISFNTQSRTRRIRASYDGGITWQPIDAGLQAQNFSDVLWRPVYAAFSAQGSGNSVWHPADNGLPPQAFITSVVQVGEYFFCGHPAGIYRSSDQGKTWKLLLASINGKVFNLSVSGNVIYAVPRNGGC